MVMIKQASKRLFLMALCGPEILFQTQRSLKYATVITFIDVVIVSA